MTAAPHRWRPPDDDALGQPRLFIAVPVPADVEAAISEVVERVRAAATPADGRDVRWVRLDSLHLTLRFLGPTPADRVEATAAATHSAAAASRAFEVVLGRAGSFPSGKRPRALWVDVLEGAEELAALGGRVDGELRDRGWSFDDRPFRAHLTLARADGIRAGATIAARLIEAARDLELRFTADRIILFESHTGGGPARYEPVAVASLIAGPPTGEA